MPEPSQSECCRLLPPSQSPGCPALFLSFAFARKAAAWKALRGGAGGAHTKDGGELTPGGWQVPRGPRRPRRPVFLVRSQAPGRLLRRVGRREPVLGEEAAQRTVRRAWEAPAGELERHPG